jgi:hypothetical protein
VAHWILYVKYIVAKRIEGNLSLFLGKIWPGLGWLGQALKNFDAAWKLDANNIISTDITAAFPTATRDYGV